MHFAYYNEFDPKAAAWLQQLIDDKQIPYGYVDSRSILEVQPSDLRGFTQCHFFAGVGGWSLALRLAGVPDSEPVWTASLPCQPFSTAGKQLGTDDERHLAPTFLELVRQCRPPKCFGEQVASKLARTDWLPGIRLEFEALGYSFGAADLCAPCAGEVGEGWIVRSDQGSWERLIIGHPHIRQRLYWVADRRMEHTEGERESAVTEGSRERVLLTDGSSRNGGLGNTCIGGFSGRAPRSEQAFERRPSDAQPIEYGELQAGSEGSSGVGEFRGPTDGLADTSGSDELRDPRSGDEGTRPCGKQNGWGMQQADSDGAHCRFPDSSSTGLEGCRQPGEQQVQAGREGTERHTPENSGHILIPCRDGKTRRTESGIFPLVDGLPRGVVPSGDPGDPIYANATAEARAVRLKGYGNAIAPYLAAMFIQSYEEAVEP